MRIYISGKITNKENYAVAFQHAEKKLKRDGHVVMNPCIMPEGFNYEDYMHVCFAMIDVCDAIYLLEDWEISPGAKREIEYARENGKTFLYE